MKKWMMILLGVLVVIVLIIIITLGNAGMFFTPKAVEMKTGPYTYVYEEFIGEYSKTYPVFDRVYKNLKADGIQIVKGIGIYFDDPKKVPASKLRSFCGAVIEESDMQKLPELEKKYKIGTIEQKDSIVVSFPAKSMLSYMIGPMKCYPVLTKAMNEKGYTPQICFEIYDEPAKKILFVMQVIKP